MSGKRPHIQHSDLRPKREEPHHHHVAVAAAENPAVVAGPVVVGVHTLGENHSGTAVSRQKPRNWKRLVLVAVPDDDGADVDPGTVVVPDAADTLADPGKTGIPRHILGSHTID